MDWIVKRTHASHQETVTRLIEAIEGHGLTLFARIDHAGAARAAGLELPDEEVVVFGSPQAGTPLMQSDPRVGIELPLRIVVWQQGDEVLLGYRDPRSLAVVYEVGEHEATLERMASCSKSSRPRPRASVAPRLAIFSALATSRTHALAAHVPAAQALTSGFQRALLAGSIFLLAAAVIALRATNTRGEAPRDLAPDGVPEPALS